MSPAAWCLSILFVYMSVYLVLMYFYVWITGMFLRWKVTIDVELHFAKKANFKSSKAPFAHYDVYLYRLPKNKSKLANGPRAKTVNGPHSRAKGRVLRWEDDMYPPSPPCSVCGPNSTHSLPAAMIDELQPPKPWTLKPYTPWWTAPHIVSSWLSSWKLLCECIQCVAFCRRLPKSSYSGKLKFTRIFCRVLLLCSWSMMCLKCLSWTRTTQSVGQTWKVTHRKSRQACILL